MATTSIELSNPGGVIWLTVKSSGGQVAVQRQVGGEWVTSDTFSSTGSWPLNLGPVPTLFLPSGDVVFQINDSVGTKIEASR